MQHLGYMQRSLHISLSLCYFRVIVLGPWYRSRVRLVLKVCIIGNAVWVGSHDPVMLENVLQLAEKGFEFWFKY